MNTWMSVTGLAELAAELDLDFMNFIRERVSYWGHFKSLFLANLDLTEIPISLHRVDNIRILNLAANKLQSLPSYFATLPLRQLTLYDNQFEVIPEELMQNKEIYELHLDKNKIETIQIQPTDLSNIHRLDISDNPVAEKFSIHHNFLQRLKATDVHPKLFEINCPELTNLDLSDNDLTAYPTTITTPHLQWLNLAGNSIEELIPEDLPLQTLHHLDLVVKQAEVIYPDQIKDLLHIRHVRISFASPVNIEEISDKISALHRIAGKRVKLKRDQSTIEWIHQNR